VRLARENHQHQYQVEVLKFNEQRVRENEAHLREKLEDAHQILSKIATENSMTASFITSMTGVTASEYHTRYQKNEEDVRRLRMVVDLYLPQLHDTVEELTGLTNLFWGNQQELLGQEPRGNEGAARNTTVRIAELSSEIGRKVMAAKSQLREMAHSLPTTIRPSQ